MTKRLEPYDPLVAPPPSEVPLANAPIVRVIAQINFPIIASIERQEFIGPFQEAIRATYPVLRPEKGQLHTVLISAEVATRTDPQMIWRFEDVDQKWRVSLAANFLALETVLYRSREDFLQRLEVVASALLKHIRPETMERFGIRYIDCITGDDIHLIDDLVFDDVKGIVGTLAVQHAKATICENLFEKDGDNILARWGLLSKNMTIDPSVLQPVQGTSWILDLDMFTASLKPFRVETILHDAKRFAERLYVFFRWAVTNEFLRKYGGNP